MPSNFDIFGIFIDSTENEWGKKKQKKTTKRMFKKTFLKITIKFAFLEAKHKEMEGAPRLLHNTVH